MNCKSCIYYEGCSAWADLKKLTYYKDASKHCQGFEAKTNYIKLPCKIGDLVYFIKSGYSVPEKPIKTQISEIKTFSEDMELIFVTQIGRCFCESDIGHKVVFTQEEAVRKLKEMKENEN